MTASTVVALLLMLLAIICFAFAAVGTPIPRITNAVALGLMLWALANVVQMLPGRL